tara:strand:+ start:878 stop:1066 length:189 start_codon:yes stop_codon:yes gene_type:complete
MGRKRKYFTEKEKREAQRKWQMEHYKRNSDEIKAKARQRYREKKRNEIYDKKYRDLYSNLDT